jgi:hypothetical protein
LPPSRVTAGERVAFVFGGTASFDTSRRSNGRQERNSRNRP